MAARENTTISESDYVQPELWGKDHYSTLAYIETKLIESSGYSVRFDPHMRQKRRHFRLLGDPSVWNLGVPMERQYGTRLSDGTYLPWHDDWDCVADMWAAGLFLGPAADFDRGAKLQLSDVGHRAVAAIRKFKAQGGNFAECGSVVLPLLSAPMIS